MTIESSPFGPIKLTGEDAEKFREQFGLGTTQVDLPVAEVVRGNESIDYINWLQPIPPLGTKLYVEPDGAHLYCTTCGSCGEDGCCPTGQCWKARHDEVTKQRDEARSLLAGLADCINQEIRENGPHTDQITDYCGDMRQFIRRLVDYVRQRELQSLTEENARLAQALEEARKDAERYRFLRDARSPKDFYSNEPNWNVACEQGGTGTVYRGERLDAAVDAALAARVSEGG